MKPFSKEIIVSQKQQVIKQSVKINTSTALGGIMKRDKFMAKNCEWIYNAYEKEKMIIFAHNTHIAEASDNSKKKRMGQYIKKFYPGYFSIGTGFNRGEVGILGAKKVTSEYNDPIRDSYDSFFSLCKYPRFYLDLKTMENVELEAFLKTMNLSRNIGTSYYPDDQSHINYNYRKHKLSRSYDALIFYKEVSPPSRFLDD